MTCEILFLESKLHNLISHLKLTCVLILLIILQISQYGKIETNNWLALINQSKNVSKN